MCTPLVRSDKEHTEDHAAGPPMGGPSDSRQNPPLWGTLPIEMLADKFSTIEELGPSSYVRFLDSSEASGDERTRWRRQAMGAVQEFCNRIDSH